jgi:hypothetical protein
MNRIETSECPKHVMKLLIVGVFVSHFDCLESESLPTGYYHHALKIMS